MANLNGGELLLLLILAVIILGPSKLPEYAASLARAVRNLRDMAEGAKSQIKEEMGPAFDDVDWQQLDPRQYDPRRIVREALATPSDKAKSTADMAGMVPVDTAATDAGATGAAGETGASRSRGAAANTTAAGQTSVSAQADGTKQAASSAARRPATMRSPRQRFDPSLPTPFDVDAT